MAVTRRGGILILTENRHVSHSTPFTAFLSASLKGISQVILIENAITGLIILLAIIVTSLPLGIIALASAMIGTWVATISGADKESVDQGLHGYNSVLTGLAISLYLSGPDRWGFALLGAAIVTLFTAAIMNVMKDKGIPVLTFPYIFVTWLVLLASFRLRAFTLSPELVPQDLSHWKMHTGGAIELRGVMDGVGQVYFLDNMWSVIFVMIGVFWSGWKKGVYALIGTAIAWVTAYALGAEVASMNEGLYGYNAVLTILAVSVVFDSGQRLSPLTGAIAAIITVPITASIGNFLLPFGLPILTMPFVMVTWIFLSMRKVFPLL